MGFFLNLHKHTSTWNPCVKCDWFDAKDFKLVYTTVLSLHINVPGYIIILVMLFSTSYKDCMYFFPLKMKLIRTFFTSDEACQTVIPSPLPFSAINLGCTSGL